jgi:protein-S-isoprenylcysteine O-methyltransferase Ste14
MSFDRVGDISDRNPEDTASRLFDLRTIIGVLFVFYGVLLIVVGLFDSTEEIQKANGIRINIWIGLGMFVLGALFLLWVWLRPLRIDQSPSAAEQAGLDGGPP